jgi:hypothetical protein
MLTCGLWSAGPATTSTTPMWIPRPCAPPPRSFLCGTTTSTPSEHLLPAILSSVQTSLRRSRGRNLPPAPAGLFVRSECVKARDARTGSSAGRQLTLCLSHHAATHGRAAPRTTSRRLRATGTSAACARCRVGQLLVCRPAPCSIRLHSKCRVVQARRHALARSPTSCGHQYLQAADAAASSLPCSVLRADAHPPGQRRQQAAGAQQMKTTVSDIAAHERGALHCCGPVDTAVSGACRSTAALRSAS